MNENILNLAQKLAGEFNNKNQALAQPIWFVNLHLWHRPIPFLIQGNIALFAEQSPAVNLNQPYRQRLLIIKTPNKSSSSNSQHLIVQYMAFKQPEKYQGAGTNPTLLHQLSLEDLEDLPGCFLEVKYQQDTFIAKPPPEAKCYFQYQGKTRQVVLGFEVNNTEFKSFDRGVDTETGKALWGAIIDSYQFKKIQDFASELPQ